MNICHRAVRRGETAAPQDQRKDLIARSRDVRGDHRIDERVKPVVPAFVRPAEFQVKFSTLSAGDGRPHAARTKRSARKRHDIVAYLQEAPAEREAASGGEKALTAIALMFAIYSVQADPCCLIDELTRNGRCDVGGSPRCARHLDRTQFILITHNAGRCDRQPAVRRDDGGAGRVEADLSSVALGGRDSLRDTKAVAPSVRISHRVMSPDPFSDERG